MKEGHIHRAQSEGGVEIAGTVSGQGPPLVLLHGALDDGEMDWGEALPYLTERFTCYVMSTRGRGLSDDHPDHSLDALVGDVTAFVESIGGPVALAGQSGGGALTLAAAARSPAIAAAAAYEPPLREAMDAATEARFTALVDQMADATAKGSPTEAVRRFCEFVCNNNELAAVAEMNGFELASRYIQVDLEEFRQDIAPKGANPKAASALKQITAPVLLLRGSQTALPWLANAAAYAAKHIPNAEVRDIPGAGHLGPTFEPERVAGELTQFFETTAHDGGRSR